MYTILHYKNYNNKLITTGKCQLLTLNQRPFRFATFEYNYAAVWPFHAEVNSI